MPLPVIIHRLSQQQSTPSNSSLPDSPSSVAETISQNTYSQSTINTILNSYTETVPSNDCDPLPTKGLLQICVYGKFLKYYYFLI